MSELKPEKKGFDYQAWMVSIATAGTIGCFGFLWSLNVTATKLDSNDIQKTKDIDKLQQGLNNLQLDMRDVRERVIRIEGEKKISPQ